MGSVELIPYPQEASYWANAYFSSSGQLSLLHTYALDNSDVYQYKDGHWVLIRRELKSIVPGLTPFGVSADGNRIIFSDFTKMDVIDGSMAITLPQVWTYNETRNGRIYQEHVFGYIHHGHISSNGRVVTMMGQDFDREEYDSLAWFGENSLVNLSEDLPRDQYDYGVGIPNEDGSVIVFPASDSGYPSASGAAKIWRWSDGELFEIPSLSLFEDEGRSVDDISAGGQIVFGTSEGPARGGIADEHLEEVDLWARPFGGQCIAWKWTESGGIVPIIDESRFLETRMVSANADGSVALIYARPRGSRYMEEYLWLGGDQFVELDELFHSLNLSIDAEWFSLYEISDDGTKLMGSASVDGGFATHAIIVTIPDLTP